MKDTLTEMQRGDRAWISVQSTIAGPLGCDQTEGCQIALKFSLENIGNLPATRVLSDAVGIADQHPDHLDIPTEEQRIFELFFSLGIPGRRHLPKRQADCNGHLLYKT